MAAKGVVAAGEEPALKPRATKRKAEEAPEGDESQRKPRTIERVGRSELEQGADAAWKGEPQAPEKKMTLLPLKEVDSILAKVMDDDRLPPDFRALKRHNPDLVPWPEEEADQELVDFYEVVRYFYAVGEEFREFQTWVRGEYEKHGYVQVDEEFLADRDEGGELIEEARKEALKGFEFSAFVD